MSRYVPEQVGRSAWRAAIIGLLAVAGATISATLIIASQGQAHDATLTLDRFTDQWEIRSGRVEADRLVLRPATGSIGLALRPIDSAAFTLQSRVEFDSPQGAAGLIVQAEDADHFTAFLISGDGYFRVSDYRNGAWIDRAAWRAWPHIRRAECSGAACTFFVNDEWTWQEEDLPVTRLIGLIADPQTAREPFEARFDEVAQRP
jgi:hypothetical protein